MSNTTTSPNMSLPVPTVSVDSGPDWANNINSCLSIIDGHNHTSGSGVQITPSGLNINADLTLGNNNLTSARSVRFTAQNSPLALASDVGCLYESGVDLYYNDGVGNQVRITQSGSVTGSTGTITGLPSGTASAAYSAGTFTFQSVTSTPATMNVGPLIVGNQVASSKTVTIAPNSGIAANYSFTLPAALPAATNYMTLDSSGNVGYNSSATTGSGAVVLATSPSITSPALATPTMSTPTVSSGALTVSSSGITFTSGTMVDYAEGTWSPVFTTTLGSGTISLDGTARYQRVGNVVNCRMFVTVSTPTEQLFKSSVTLPVAPNNNWASNTNVVGVAGSSLITISAIVGGKLALCQFSSTGSLTITDAAVMFTYYINN